VKVKYPEQQTKLPVPKRSDLKHMPQCDSESNNVTSDMSDTDFGPVATVPVSNQVWIEGVPQALA
jgi:hypothetical protein